GVPDLQLTADLHAAVRLPQKLDTACRQSAAVWAEGEAADQAREAVQGKYLLPGSQGAGVPDLHGAVAGPDGQAPAVGAEGDATIGVGQVLSRLALLQVPELPPAGANPGRGQVAGQEPADRLPHRCRRQDPAIRAEGQAPDRPGMTPQRVQQPAGGGLPDL